jgi:hypothetical protein
MNRRGSLTFGLILILLGGWFLTLQFVPSIADWFESVVDWPFWIIGPGLIFLFAALVSTVTELAIPGSIITGIGLILTYQNETGDWVSWSYAWALIISFVGIGIFLSYALRGKFRKAFSEASGPFMTGLVMFLIFGSIFRAAYGQSPFMGDYWPVLLIALGLWMLVRPFFRRSKAPTKVTVTATLEKEEDELAPWEQELEAAFEEVDEEDEAS